jgi:hypothetical protein
MAYCDKFCGGPGKWAKNPSGTSYFIHNDGNCQGHINRKLSLNHRQSIYQRFTTPEKCDICKRDYFYWLENENGGKVCFDELGPPWPKHDCDEHREKHPKPSYQWVIEGYEPCMIEGVDSQFICDHELVVHIYGLNSRRKFSLGVKNNIISFISHLHQPFYCRFIDNEHLLELNTYRQSGASYVPLSYKWPKADHSFQPPL